MRFGMYGGMSDGTGLYDFYTYDAEKMKKLMNNPFSFEFMNYLIIYLLEECYTYNDTFNTITLTKKDIEKNSFSVQLTEGDIDETLFYIQSEGLVRIEKKEEEWVIRFL